MSTLGRFKLKKDPGLGEISTAVGVGAVCAAALYNFGYFAVFQCSYLSLLSVQDLLLGAVVIVPILILISLLVPAYVTLSNRSTSLAAMIVRIVCVALLLAIGGVIALTQGGNFALVSFLFVYLAVLILCDIVRLIDGLRVAAYSLFGVAAIGFPIVLGYVVAIGQISGPLTRLSTVRINDGQAKLGQIMRVTSSHLLMFDGSKSTLLPITSVKEIVQEHP